MLTSEGSAIAAELLRDNCPTVCWFRVACDLWCPSKWRERNGTDRTPQKQYEGRRLVREALKLVKQLVDTGGLFVWEWPRGCQAQRLPEIQLLRKQCGNLLSYSELDACALGVRDETTKCRMRKEWTFMTNSETSHKTLNLRCSHERTVQLSARKLHHKCGPRPNHVKVRKFRWIGAKEHVSVSPTASLQCL